ncbi:flagellin [Ectothiorhodospira sp. BSL-9]|uniref:flagellin N-terminal helical domain-containing protein n=1 Tax=Ectothiorhodospira sp. BSL-9 TaxID=1442136 RepID=UPI0007B43F76|nr:flagellin [Ectothiorhodospira sp. BSL-9]ANB03144.1 hypothetical protein ECTOBSL9_2724 [Ectothiorhodospira sp. BSL-9]
MAQVINTNIASLNAQRNLNTSQGQLQQALERLSSGLRINSAKDDAAGLSIAERFTSQINGVNQAGRNANDGISFAQTAEGALGELGNITQRIRELAVQSANDTNSAADRRALDQEVQQLIKEANRIASTTQFNGGNVLDGSRLELFFQVGANQGQTIEVDGVDARGSKLGASVREAVPLGAVTDELGIFADGTAGNLDGIVLTGATGAAAAVTSGAAAEFSLTNLDGEGSTKFTWVDASKEPDLNQGEFHSSEDLINAINRASEKTGIQAIGNERVEVNLGGFTAAADRLTINDVAFTLSTSGGGGISTLDDLVTAINSRQAQTDGVIATKNDDDELILTSRASVPINLITDSGGNFSGLANATDARFEAGFTLLGDFDSRISFGDGSEDFVVNNLGFDPTDDGGLSQRTLSEMSVATREDASNAITTADYVLGQVNGLRSVLGAVQNRFETTISNLAITGENLDASRSRIQDADFAAETAALTRGQILQQAGTSVLAQANQLPQSVLQLLQ